jgi:hypothetical protein
LSCEKEIKYREKVMPLLWASEDAMSSKLVA